MSNSLLAAALSAVTNNTVITYDDYLSKKLGYACEYNGLDQISLHQSHLVGGQVPSDRPVKSVESFKSIKYVKSITRPATTKYGGSRAIFVKTLTGKTL